MLHHPSGSPTTSPRARRSRIPGLDGLRALAVALVLVYHLWPAALPGGYLGVDIFFVISGFLITTLLLDEVAEHERVRLLRFWRRRARRLLPALVTLLLACSTVALLVGGDVLVRLGTQVLGAATFSLNWVALTTGASYFEAASPDLFRNLWSLAVEEQFYLLWPLLLPALIRLRRAAAVALLLCGAAASALGMAALAAHSADATRAYFGTDSHGFGLLVGAALAFGLRGRFLPALPRQQQRALTVAGFVAGGGLLLLAATMEADATWTYRGGLALVTALTAVLIAAAQLPSSPLAVALGRRQLRWLGDRSYGLYLWHWPVMVLLGAALPTWRSEPVAAAALGMIALALTLALGELSFRLVEQPARRRGLRGVLAAFARSWRGAPHRVALAATIALLVVGTSGATVAAIAVDPGRSDAQREIEEGQAAVAAAGSAAAPTPAPAPAETPAETPAPALPAGDQIIAVGDSVMLAAAPELQQAFPGIEIDAKVSRQLHEAPGILRALADAGRLRSTVVLGLGTNGPIERATLDEVRAVIGRDRTLVLVNARAPRGWTAGVNAILADYAQRHRDVVLANWHDAIAPRLDLLAADQIHPGGAGGRVYVDTVRDALQSLAELPPLLDPNDYGHNRRPR